MRVRAIRGLVLKELLNVQTAALVILLLCGIYLVIGILQGETFLYAVLVFVMAGQVSTSFTFDSLSKFDTYAMTLNVTRREIITARYMYGIVMTVTGLLISIAMVYIQSFITNDVAISNAINVIFISAWSATLYQSLVMPFLYRFGVERTKILMFLFMLVPMVSIFTFGGDAHIAPSNPLAFVASLFVYFLSSRLSARVLERKES